MCLKVLKVTRGFFVKMSLFAAQSKICMTCLWLIATLKRLTAPRPNYSFNLYHQPSTQSWSFGGSQAGEKAIKDSLGRNLLYIFFSSWLCRISYIHFTFLIFSNLCTWSWCPNPGPQEAGAGGGEEGNKGFPGEKPDWRGDTGQVIWIQESQLQTSSFTHETMLMSTILFTFLRWWFPRWRSISEILVGGFIFLHIKRRKPLQIPSI